MMVLKLFRAGCYTCCLPLSVCVWGSGDAASAAQRGGDTIAHKACVLADALCLKNQGFPHRWELGSWLFR